MIWPGFVARLVHVSVALLTIDAPALTLASSLALNVSVLVAPLASLSYVAVKVLPPEGGVSVVGTTPAVCVSDAAT